MHSILNQITADRLTLTCTTTMLIPSRVINQKLGAISEPNLATRLSVDVTCTGELVDHDLGIDCAWRPDGTPNYIQYFSFPPLGLGSLNTEKLTTDSKPRGSNSVTNWSASVQTVFASHTSELSSHGLYKVNVLEGELNI